MADLLQFDIPSGARIADAVRTVEDTFPRARPLTFSPILQPHLGKGSAAFRICKYTGSWSIGEEKTVTFKYQTTTPNTLSATNLFFPLPDNQTRDCAVGREGTAWYLLQVQFDTSMMVTSVALTESALEFTRVVGLSLGTASTVQVSISTCATTGG